MDRKPPTDTMNVALPEGMKQFVHDEVVAGGYGSASEYVRQLIREAQERKAAEAELEALLQEGLDSGSPVEADEAYWERKRKRLFKPSKAKRA